MGLVLLLLLLAYPLLEIALMIRVGGLIGLWPTLGLIVATAIVGALTLRRQGFTTLNKVSEAMQRGDAPVAPMLDGALMGLGGVLLVIPGFITDTVGLMLIVPPLRGLIARWLARRMIASGSVHVDMGAAGRGHEAQWRQRERPGGQDRSGPTVIDGEYERLDERPLGDDKADGPDDNGKPPPRLRG